MSETTDKIRFGAQEPALMPCPINPAWIIEGAPVARTQILSRSADGTATSLIWDCTKGVFNWHYDIDETVYVLEGSVVVRDDAGAEHRLGVGDHAIFRAGSHAVWRVDDYVRKVAFCRNPVPQALITAKRIARNILVATGLRPAPSDAPAMFGG